MSNDDNSCFKTLALFAKLYHKQHDLNSLISTLPIQKGRIEPDLFGIDYVNNNFAKAAHNAGLDCKIIKQRIEDIDELTLPLILLKKDQTGIILDSLNEAEGTAQILLASSGDTVLTVGLEKLKEDYSGYLVLLGKKFEYHTKKNKTLLDQKHWFWSSLKPSIPIYMDVLKASLVINLFVLAVPLFSRNVYDRVIPNNAIETLWVLAAGVVIVLLFDSILKFMRTYFLEIAARKSDIIISAKLFEHVMGLRSEFSPVSVGSFAIHFKEFDSVRNFLASSVLTLVIDLPFLFIFLGVIYYIGGVIVLVPAFIMALVLVYTLLIAKPLYKSIEATYQAIASKNSILIETLTALETIKVFNAYNTIQYKYEEANGYIADKNVTTKIMSASISTITGVLIQLNTVFVAIVGVYLIQDLQLSMGGLIAIVILSSRTISPVGQVAGLISTWEQTKVAYKALNDIMAREVERDESKEYISLKNIKGSIEFRQVSFAYPNGEGECLKNVSFKVNEGEKFALLGKIGSGKSTILKLVLGLYKPQSGSILIDGVDINQVDPVILRDNISYVPQEVMLFEGSIKDNVACGVPYIDDESIIRASKVSSLHEFTQKSPNGYDSHIVEGGKNLSGGQRQSVAIARAFLKDKPIVLFDEPTNAMDTVSESYSRSNLVTKTRDKTILLVTHKMNMLDLVDNVIILEEGQIVYNGPKSSLENWMANEQK